MRRPESLILSLAFCIVALLCSCDARRGVVTIRVVATSDVHGNVFSHDALDGTERDGSLARVASFLKKERKENPDLVYIDAGDILQGSVEMYRDNTAEYVKPSLAGCAYNLLGCDAMALGNHELAIGLVNCDRFLDVADFPVLAANLGFEDYGDYYPPYQIIERHGVRIAVLGLVTPSVEYSIPTDVLGEFGVCDMESAALHWIPVLRQEEKADVIIGLVHAGIENDRSKSAVPQEVNRISRLLEQASGFDLIVYGHDHLCSVSRQADCSGDSLWIVNPGPYAENVAIADISLDFRNSDSPEPQVNAWIESLSAVRPDEGFATALHDRWTDTQTYCDSIVGAIDVPLVAGNALWSTSSTADYIHSVQLGFHGAQVSIASAVQIPDVIPAGNVTIRDMFSLYPFDNTMVSVMLRGSEIRDVLEYSVNCYYNTVSGKGGSLLNISQPVERYLTAAGITYTIDVTEQYGNRVNVISMSDGSDFDMKAFYRTTVSSFLFGGSESVLSPATGISGLGLQKRINASSRADIRFYIITQFALAKESGRAVGIPETAHWKLVPEDVAREYLAKDTIDIKTTH